MPKSIQIPAKNSDFPRNIIDKLIKFESQHDSIQTITIFFTNKIYLDDEHIEDFFDYIDSHFQHAKIQFENTHQISKSSVMCLLHNQHFIQYIDDETLIDLIPATEETAEYCLHQPALSARINQLKLPVNEQTFPSSCAAMSIMQYLRDTKKLPESEFTRCKELEIYSKIWKSPGEEADLVKIIQFCRSNNINLVGIDIQNCSQQFLSNHSSKQLKQLYGLFQQTLIDHYHQLKSTDTNFDPFKIASKILLVFINDETQDTHLVYAYKASNGRITMIDSDNKERSLSEYTSWDKFINSEAEFTGIGLGLTSQS